MATLHGPTALHSPSCFFYYLATLPASAQILQLGFLLMIEAVIQSYKRQSNSIDNIVENHGLAELELSCQTLHSLHSNQ